MLRLFKILKSLFSSNVKIENIDISPKSSNGNKIVGNNSTLINFSESNQYIYSESEKNYKYNRNIERIHLSLSFLPYLFFILSILFIAFTSYPYIMFLFALIIISLIIFRSATIPKQFNSFTIFKLNIYSIFAVFLSYYYLVLPLSHKLYSYSLDSPFKIPFSLLLKEKEYTILNNIHISNTYLFYLEFLILFSALLIIMSSNVKRQWAVYLYGNKDYPFTIALQFKMIISSILISVFPLVMYFILNWLVLLTSLKTK